MSLGTLFPWDEGSMNLCRSIWDKQNVWQEIGSAGGFLSLVMVTWAATFSVLFFQVNWKNLGSTLVLLREEFLKNKILKNIMSLLPFLPNRGVFFYVTVLRRTGSCSDHLLHMPGFRIFLFLVQTPHCRIQKEFTWNTFLMDFYLEIYFPIGRIPQLSPQKSEKFRSMSGSTPQLLTRSSGWFQIPREVAVGHQRHSGSIAHHCLMFSASI